MIIMSLPLVLIALLLFFPSLSYWADTIFLVGSYMVLIQVSRNVELYAYFRIGQQESAVVDVFISEPGLH